MKLLTFINSQGGALFALACACGFSTTQHPTLEGAGREADLHMAEKFPRGSQRRPCVPANEHPDGFPI